MDLTVLQTIACELNEELRGGFVNKIHQPLPREIVLRVRVPGEGEKKLMVSADPQMGRIHLTALRVPNPPAPPRFCAYLRAHFQGGTITDVSCASDDRVVTIATGRGSGVDRSQRLLIIELLGRDSNIILVDGGNRVILECLRRIPPKETTTRIVTPGTLYEAPPQRAARQPSSWPLVDKIIPGIITGSNGKRKLTVSATLDDEVFPSMNSAADAFYGPKLRGLLLEGLRREVARPVKAAIAALERRAQKIQNDLERLREFVSYAEQGELLKANLSLMRKGMAEIEVQDWVSGEKHNIPLDPALDPVTNMERKFKAAARGKRGQSLAQERLERTLEEKSGLEDLLFFIDAAQDTEELEQLADEVPSVRKAVKPDPASKDPHGKPGSSLFRTYHTPGGFMALVGKSGKGNDLLLRTRAREGDSWFHVKDGPGAHVVLLQQEGRLAAAEDIAYAAGLAVFFSRARGKGKAEVMVSDVKNVFRSKGAAPGRVTVRVYNSMLAEEINPEEGS
ncbi:MAG: NFACT family protein [Desulfomonile sp.]|nr:NFACT family protein [Desulfomonile sp.]